VVTHDHQPAPLGRLDEPPALLVARGQRLLDEDVLARVERRESDVAGVATATASTAGSARTSSSDAVASTPAYGPATRAARATSVSHTYLRSMSAQVMAFRTRFGPQYPAPTTAKVTGDGGPPT